MDINQEGYIAPAEGQHIQGLPAAHLPLPGSIIRNDTMRSRLVWTGLPKPVAHLNDLSFVLFWLSERSVIVVVWIAASLLRVP